MSEKIVDYAIVVPSGRIILKNCAFKKEVEIHIYTLTSDVDGFFNLYIELVIESIERRVIRIASITPDDINAGDTPIQLRKAAIQKSLNTEITNRLNPAIEISYALKDGMWLKCIKIVIETPGKKFVRRIPQTNLLDYFVIK